MMSEQQILELLKPIQEPFLHKSIVDADSVKEIKIKENYVGLKISIAQANSPEQMQLQQEIVNTLKSAGVESVGLRFEQRQEGAEPQQKEQKTGSEATETTFIAVASGKGGVGKSTVSVNLATSLARQGKRVGLIDADIYGFSVPDMMGIAERPKVIGEQIFPVERFDVKVISMAFFVEDNAPVIWRGPMLGKMLTNFFNDIEWGDLDYLILDLPPGTGDVALDVHKMLPQCKEVIVTTPHPTAAFVAARAGAMALKTDHDILGVIENMAYFESEKTGEKEYVFGQGGAEKLTEELNTEILGRIPLGQPEMHEEDFAPSIYGENSKIGQIYKQIALNVISKVEG